jgi:hypothetical protein
MCNDIRHYPTHKKKSNWTYKRIRVKTSFCNIVENLLAVSKDVIFRYNSDIIPI